MWFIGAKSSSIPFNHTLKLYVSDDSRLKDPSSYKILIDMLIYLTNTMSYIFHYVQYFLQFISKPLLPCYQVAAIILRYLKSFLAQGIVFSTFNDLKIYSFADSDWVMCPDLRKPITRHCVMDFSIAKAHFLGYLLSKIT